MSAGQVGNDSKNPDAYKIITSMCMEAPKAKPKNV